MGFLKENWFLLSAATSFLCGTLVCVLKITWSLSRKLERLESWDSFRSRLESRVDSLEDKDMLREQREKSEAALDVFRDSALKELAKDMLRVRIKLGLTSGQMEAVNDTRAVTRPGRDKR